MHSGVSIVEKCRACGTPLPQENVFSLGDMPVVSFPETPDAEQLISPIELVECSFCTLVQLRHSVDPDLMFRNYWYRSGVTESMKVALKDVVEGAQKFVKLEAGDTVCDIGSNDGTLLSYYPEGIERLGFEPSDVPVLHEGMMIVREFFSKDNCPPCLQGKFKIVTAISMFYDLNDPGQFLEDVKWALAPDGIFVVQMNYLVSMLMNLAMDNIEHEHVAYYSAWAFQKLCDAHGMGIVAMVENDVNGGSIRFYVKPSSKTPTSLTPFIVEEEIGGAAWDNFNAALLNMKGKVLGYIVKCIRQEKRLGICGASTRGLALLHYLGLDSKTFSCASERDPAKHGRFYGATGIPIVSEEEARKRCDVMMILPYHFEKEIVAREKDFLTAFGELIVPLPNSKVVRRFGETFL
jgi:hypothetical protein